MNGSTKSQKNCWLQNQWAMKDHFKEEWSSSSYVSSKSMDKIEYVLFYTEYEYVGFFFSAALSSEVVLY